MKLPFSKSSKDFANDIMWSMTHDGFAIVANLTAFLLLGRNLGTEGYGAYVGVFGVLSPLAGLAWAGVGLSAMQRILRDKEDPADVARRLLSQGLLMGVVGVVVATTIAGLTVRTLSIWAITSLAIGELLALNVVMISTFVLQGAEGVPAASRIRIGVVMTRLAIVVTLFLTDQITVLAVGVLSIIFFSAFTAWMLLVRLPASGLHVWPGRTSVEDTKMSLTFSVPMVGSNIQQDGDKTVLNAYGQADVAGVYAAAFRVINMASTPIRAIQAAAVNRLLPHDEDEIGQHNDRALKFALLNLAVVLPICAFLFFAVELFEPLLGEDFERSAKMARWLLILLPINAMGDAPLGALLGLGRHQTRAWIVLIASATSTVLYIALIPIWSWAGAVVGTVVGELVLLLLGINRMRHWQSEHDVGVYSRRLDATTADPEVINR